MTCCLRMTVLCVHTLLMTLTIMNHFSNCEILCSYSQFKKRHKSFTGRLSTSVRAGDQYFRIFSELHLLWKFFYLSTAPEVSSRLAKPISVFWKTFKEIVEKARYQAQD